MSQIFIVGEANTHIPGATPTMAQKAIFVIKKKLGGMMFWELTEDVPTDGLVDEISKALN